jgi:hypothetical protein
VRTQLSLVFTVIVADLAEFPQHLLLSISYFATQRNFSTGPSGTQPRIYACPRTDTDRLETCAAGRVSAYFEEVILPIINLSYNKQTRGLR